MAEHNWVASVLLIRLKNLKCDVIQRDERGGGKIGNSGHFGVSRWVVVSLRLVPKGIRN